MASARAVLPDELDEMLALMCAGFDMPFDEARPIFYSDPDFNSDNKRVLVRDGKVVSCLTIVDMPLMISGQAVPAAGIAGVATLAEHQGRGYATQLLADTLKYLRENGYPLVFLSPSTTGLYRRLGFEMVGAQHRLAVAPSTLPSFAEAMMAVNLSEEHLSSSARLFEQSHRSAFLHRPRSMERWRQILRFLPESLFVQIGDHCGYALLEMRSLPDGSSIVKIIEMAAESDACRRAIVGCFARFDVDGILYTSPLPEINRSGLASCGETPEAAGSEIVTMPGLMFRILDMPRLLNAMRISDEPDLPFTIVTEECEPFAGTYEVAVHPSHGSSGLGRVEGNLHTWTRVLLGGLSAAEAFSLGMLSTDCPQSQTAAEMAFPKRDLFLSPADHP